MRKILLIVCMLMIISGCGKKDDNLLNDTLTNDENEIIEEVEYIIDPNDKTRPYAVMINCRDEALPQSGLQDAYIVYELNVEYGITRMLALFKNKNTAKIGSIRSARTQYLDYVLENDAIFVHAGGASDALSNIPKLGIDDIDVDRYYQEKIYGFRDTNLNRAFEHTLFTSIENLNEARNDLSISKESDNNSLLKYSNTDFDFSKYESSIKADNVNIVYSTYRSSIYTYDSNKKIYLRNMSNYKNIDLITNQQYEVKNIIAYNVPYSTYTYDGYYGYQKIDNIGMGEGYYISNGYAIPIIWEKNDKAAKTIYKIKETNEELIVNNGNTYIQIYPTNQPLSIN